MIRAVIFALLALSVRAAHYGHSSYLSGIPSYSYSSYPSSVYGSGLLGSLYGSGVTYGSGLHYGSGHHYGSGLGHGIVGSGLHYGLGGVRTLHGGHATHLTSAIRPSIYSSRYDTSGAILNKGPIISNAPGKMEFIMGGAGQKAQIGAVTAYNKPPVIKYAPRVPYSSGAMLGNGFITNEGPAKIEFVLGGTGFKTGAAALEGHGKPAIHKYAPMIPHSTGSMLDSGALANDAPGKIEFILGDSGYKTGSADISGQAKPIVLKPAIRGPQRRVAGGLARSSVHGQAGISPLQPAINALTGAVVASKSTRRVPYSSGAMLGEGILSNAAPAQMEFMLGGTGFKTGAAALEGYKKPAAIQYTPRVPYSSGAMLGGGIVSNAAAPGQMEFVLGGTGFKTGAAALEGHRKPAAIHNTGMYGGARAISAGRTAIRPFPKVSSPITGAALPSHGSGIDAASLHTAGISGISVIGGNENIINAQDIAGVSGLLSSGVIPAAPVLTAGGAIKPSARTIHRPNLIRKSGAHGLSSGVAAGPHMSFDMGQAALRKPGMNIASMDKIIAPGVVSRHGSGIDAASLHSAGITGISAIGGHGNIHFAQDITGVSGLHSSGINPAVPTLTAGGAIKPSTGNIHRTNLIRKSGAHSLASGIAAGPHMSFNMGEATLRKPGMNIASKDKLIAPAVISSHGSGHDAAFFHNSGISGISMISGPENILHSQDITGMSGLHSSGVIPAVPVVTTGGAIKPSSYNARRANLFPKSGAHGLTSGMTGSHVSFNLGDAALNKPAMNFGSLEKIIPSAIATRPFSSSGIRRVSPNIPAYGSSGSAGPAGISFIQDFSKSVGSQTAGIRPVLSIGDKLTAPVIPSMVASPRNHAAFRATAGLIPSAIVKPVSGASFYKAPKLPGSSLAGSISQGGHIFASGPSAEGHVIDFKQGTTGLSGQVGGRLASFEIAPESGVAHFDKSSVLTHSSADAAIPGGILSDVHHSSSGVSGGSHHRSTESLNRMSGDKTSIFVDGAIGDKSTILFHSTGVNGAENLMGDKGSFIELVPTGINSALSGQGMVLSRSGAMPAFPNFPSSSHSGFSHVAREHATDKSIFYSGESPRLVRPVLRGDIIRK